MTLDQLNKLDTALRNAECLYNIIVNSSICLDYSNKSETIIKDFKEMYSQALYDLKRQGIGGIRINGTFRNIND